MDKSSDATTVVSARDVVLKMQLDYSRGVKDQTTKNVEALCGLCWMLEKPHLDSEVFMKEISDILLRLFSIESVGIGVMDPTENLYRYLVIGGLDKEIEDGYKQLRYTKEQLLEPSSYPSYEISKHTRLFLSEDHPYTEGEEFTYRRPGLLGMRRRTVTDSLEADYLDILFYDADGEVMGFIEVSGTRMKKLPSVAAIKWIELLAGVLGIVLQRERAAGSQRA